MSETQAFEWKPWTYRSVDSGEMAEDPTVLLSDNGREYGKPGYMSVVVQPGSFGWKPIVDAPSWPKAYYVRDFETQERAIAIGEALMRLSLRQTQDYPRLDLYRVVDGINASMESPS